MSIDKKKVTTLFALTLLIISLVAINFNLPTSASPSDDLLYLHGPSLTPIHMHSNITLNPIHMHHTKGILWPGMYPITEPNCTTDWIRIDPDLDPIDFEVWHLTSWEDWGEPFEELSQNDQIDMNNTDTGKIEWFHVDRMTLTLNLSGPYPTPTHEPGPTSMLLEMKQPYCSPYDPYAVYDPLFTVWHQVWPLYSPIFTITDWINDPFNPNTVLDSTDSISFDQGLTWWHVEDVATDLILRWKMMDPRGTWWHELYPEYCEWYNITSWESFPDPWCDRISPKDTIDMFRFSDQTTHWYFVDRVTITINVTSVEPPFDWMMLELKTHSFEEMYDWIKKPLDSSWHEVYPEYCTVFNLTWWDPMDPLWDNCNGVLDPCDNIELQNMTDLSYMAYHITDMAYDIILNEYITDPVCTDWHELHPDCTQNTYHIQAWENNTLDVWLSPCDNVTLSDPTGLPTDYHVENVTLTLDVTILDITGSGPFMTIGETIYLEHIQDAWNYSWPRLYHPKIEPWDTKWTVVCPIDYFGEELLIWLWYDNCNGVLSYCDDLVLLNPTQQLVVHVDEVAVDMVVKKIGEQPPPPPPPPMYWKANYTDYAPSGVPDFNQRQGLFNPGMWTWCVPTAVANCLLWMDSRFETSTTPPPAISNTFDLVSNYTPGIDDHDPLNVDPFINHLAYLMDTDGIRTTILHAGTNVVDAQAGIAHYLSWTGLNPLGDVNGDGKVNMTDYTIALAANNTIPGVPGWNMAADIYPVTLGWPSWGLADNVVNQSDLDLINAHMNENGTFYEKTVETPDFVFIEEEVERSEDVILGLDFYNVQWEKTYDPLKELGHAVTVAGVNSTSVPPRIAISDPDNDNAEPPPQGTSGPGRVLPPPPHPHPPGPPDTVHNNASYVSHDIYNVTFIAPPPFISNASWALDKYPGPIGYPIATVEWAIIISPLPLEEVCGVDITDVVTTYRGTVVDGGFTTWTINVTVTVHNNGTQTTDCTVNAYYYNATTPDVLIGTQVVPSLAPCNPVNVTFSWNLASLPECTSYTVKANATCLCAAYDEFVDGQVRVRLLGDTSGDDLVDGLDKIIVGIALFTVPGDPLWNPYADVSGDGIVDGLDKIWVGIQLFKACPP